MPQKAVKDSSAPPGRKATTASAVAVASMPWAFTQHQPLGTSEFMKQTERRGFALDVITLRELYRHGVVVPFVYVSNRQVGPLSPPVGPEPLWGGTHLQSLRHARDRGRLTDLADVPFRPRLNFERPSSVASPRWWNGLLYSQYQLLILPELKGLLSHGTRHRREGRWSVRLPQPSQFLRMRAERLRTMIVALTALEARYLPKLDPELVHLTNVEIEDWERYRDAFDPAEMSARLSYSAARARQDAEHLLLRAHRLDPLDAAWSQLMRRAPGKSWEHLKDAALQAVDHRVAAEILLLFYEDLTTHGRAEPLPDLSGNLGWHPLHERLSYRDNTLDENLVHLGISPHPRVVLAVEGETEQIHVPLVWKALGCPDAPELMRLLKLGGVDKDLEKVAALAAAPLVGEKVPGSTAWSLIKPPTRLFIAVDPEGKFAPNKIDKTRRDILNEIKAVVKAQGVRTANPAELEELVEVRTWSESCYEFAHFTNEELADGIEDVHHGRSGWSRDELVDALAFWRDREQDIKRVWESGRWDEQQHKPTGKWAYEVPKPELAEALWPTLEAKIDRCRTDAAAPVPPIVAVVLDAYHLAQRWRYHSFVLSEETSAASKDPTPSAQ